MTSRDQRLQAVFDSVRVGIVATDAKGRAEFQNAEASRILGVSATSGRSLAEVLGDNHPAAVLITEALEHGRDVAAHACPLRPHLATGPMIADLAASPIGIGDRLDGAVLTLRDRTIGRELEALLAQRERSELFAQLASGVAHEIRNPLGGIRGAAELLEKKLENPDHRRYSELIRAETDRIRRLLDDLAELTRGGDLSPRKVNIHRVLDDLLELQSASESWPRIEVLREYDPSIPPLAVDPDRVTQVFLNLVKNAAQAMDGKGQITLRTRLETLFHINADDEGPVRMVRIDVEDTGPGICEEDLPHVFTPFFTRRDGGTGLGLAIAQHWIVRHGGRIQVECPATGGTRVRVLLPERSPG